MKISAFDLSLTGTGWAIWEGESLRSGTLITKGMSGMERLKHLLITISNMAEGSERIFMEGLSFGSNDPSAQERAGLAYLLRYRFWNRGWRYEVVAPTSLKKFVTGKGNAAKELVIKEVFKRWGLEPADNNEADAIVLLMIGRCLAGIMEPSMEAQREVLAVLRKAAAG
jgi:crossover junction endodeoxyribonuclease RuvC